MQKIFGAILFISLSGCAVIEAPFKVATTAASITAKTASAATTVVSTAATIAGTSASAAATTVEVSAQKTGLALKAANTGLKILSAKEVTEEKTSTLSADEEEDPA